jgi:mannose-6-phosphate isomerase-like protein (cupin superfamily)
MAEHTEPNNEGGEIVVLRAGEGEELSGADTRDVLAKLDIEALAVTESRYDPGVSAPADHFHREHHDCFYVLEGELTFVVEGEEIKVGEGSFVAVPPMKVHTFRNAGPGEARFLNLHAPSKGFIPHLRALRDAETDEDERRAMELFDSVDAG